MKTKLILLLLLTSQLIFAQTRVITDMAGGKVTLPVRINRILPHDEKTSLFLFPCAGTKLISRGLNPDDTDMKYIHESYRKLPITDIKNPEAVLAAAPDIIVAGCFIPEDYSRYERLSKQTNIPLVIIDLNILKMDNSYRFIGSLLGENKETQACANYLEAFYKELNQLQKSGAKNNASAYLAVGNDGLMTAPTGSKHAQLFDLLGIRNAAETEIEARGYATVSMEQIMVWKPDYIFTVDKGGDDPFTEIYSSALWKKIPAVQKKHVFHIPEEPYNWFGNPPSINRIPGLILLSEFFYRQSQKKAHEQIKAFYRTFYKYPLSETELAKLIRSK
jgi:ABC-type Fe3+-hydroxamate transport system, periplasmic component